MKSNRGLLGLFLFFADLFFTGILIVYYTGLVGPSGHTINSTFLAGVRASAILGAVCEAAPYLLIISVIFTVIYVKGFMKDEIGNVTRYGGTAFLIVSLIICIALPFNYYGSEVTVRSAAATGKFKDVNVSALRLVYAVVDAAAGSGSINRRRPVKVTTDSYYIRFDAVKCPASKEEYNDFREGRDYYIISFGGDDFECLNTEEYMLP